MQLCFEMPDEFFDELWGLEENAVLILVGGMETAEEVVARDDCEVSVANEEFLMGIEAFHFDLPGVLFGEVHEGEESLIEVAVGRHLLFRNVGEISPTNANPDPALDKL